MISKNGFFVFSAIMIGSCCPMAQADDCTNSYFATPMSPSSVEVTTSAPVVIEKTSSDPAVIETTVTAPVLIDKTVSLPVVVEKKASPPVIIEDRIVKQKHLFGIGIWPIFDFEIR